MTSVQLAKERILGEGRPIFAVKDEDGNPVDEFAFVTTIHVGVAVAGIRKRSLEAGIDPELLKLYQVLDLGDANEITFPRVTGESNARDIERSA